MSETESPRGRHAPKIVLSLLIAAFFIWLFQRGGLPLVPNGAALGDLSRSGAALYVVLVVVTMWLRTYRWVYLLRPIAPVDTLPVVCIGFVGYAAIFFAPLRMGELVRPYLLSSRQPIGFTQATGTVVAERVIDGLLVSVVLLLGLVFSHPISPLPHHIGGAPVPVQAIPSAAYTALAIFGGAFVAIALFYFARDLARRLVHAIVDVVSTKLATFITAQIERLADSLRFLASASHAGAYVRDTFLYWVASILAFWVALRASGVDASPAEACLCVGVIGLGSLIPSGPGMFGTYQLASYAALAMFCPEDRVLSHGAVFVFLTYTVQLGFAFVSAGVGYALMQPSRRPS